MLASKSTSLNIKYFVYNFLEQTAFIDVQNDYTTVLYSIVFTNLNQAHKIYPNYC